MRLIKLLVVEDEPLLLETLSSDLRQRGFEVSSAADGAAALAIMEHFAADILITDIRMPNMTGIELATVLCEKFPLLQVIFISAYSDMAYVRAAMQLRSIDYVLKPVNMFDLTEALKRAISALDAAKTDTLRRDFMFRHMDMLQLRCIEDIIEGRVSIADRSIKALGLDQISGLWGIIWVGNASAADVKPEISKSFASVPSLKCSLLHVVQCGDGRVACAFVLDVPSQPHQLDQICEQLRMNMQIISGTSATVYRSALCESLEILINNIKGGVQPGANEPSASYAQSLCMSIEAEIAKSYQEHSLSVSSIAQTLHYSVPYICSVYKRFRPFTITDYINRYRIARVKELILLTDMSLSEIATAVGYDTAAYMSRVFRREEGVAPSVYRSGKGS